MNRMHDWTLTSISYDWAAHQIVISFKAERGVVSIRGDGVKDLKIPHSEEWGKSSSVNYASVEDIDQDNAKLVIEMQSGDVIEVVGGRFLTLK